MKKTLSLLTLSIFALGMMIASCTGPEGPQGPQGPAGADGTDGTDGVDANSFCINCHTVGNKTMVKEMFAMSSHAIGNYVGYAGGRSDCAKCHSHQGAMETNLTGRDTTAANIPIPTAWQCETCHDFHMTLDSTEFPDYALRVTDPISLISTGHTTSIDLPGSGNACATCHQTRRSTSAFGSGDSVNVSSTHWGGHHGPQGNILAGVGAYEPTGSMTIANGAHTTMVGCSDCHMAMDESRKDVGGHTWMMEAEDGYQNIAGCVSCHADATSFDIGGVQTEVTELLETLHGLLVDAGHLQEDGHPVTGMKSEQEAGAIFNYILFEEDRSMGVHNPKYVEACLTNTIEMVQSW